MEKHSACDIIVPTYNGSSHLPRLLESIEKQSLDQYTCFVIDDNSADNTVEIVRENYPWVHLITQPENMGPSHNRNVAIAAGKSPYIVIFDDDTYLDDTDWLSRAVTHMDENPDVGQLAAMIVNGFHPEVLLDCGIIKNWYLFGGIFHNVNHADARGRQDKGRRVLGACSAGTVLRRDLFDLVGRFDPYYYYPCEDLDLSLRIHLAGYDVRYEPSLKVFHYESQAMGKSLDRKMFLYRRNCLLVLTENFPVLHSAGMYLAMVVREILKPTLKYIFYKLSATKSESFPRSVNHYVKSLFFIAGSSPRIARKRIASGRFRKRPRSCLVRINRDLAGDLSE